LNEQYKKLNNEFKLLQKELDTTNSKLSLAKKYETNTSIEECDEEKLMEKIEDLESENKKYKQELQEISLSEEKLIEKIEDLVTVNKKFKQNL